MASFYNVPNGEEDGDYIDCVCRKCVYTHTERKKETEALQLHNHATPLGLFEVPNVTPLHSSLLLVLSVSCLGRLVGFLFVVVVVAIKHCESDTLGVLISLIILVDATTTILTILLDLIYT